MERFARGSRQRIYRKDHGLKPTRQEGSGSHHSMNKMAQRDSCPTTVLLLYTQAAMNRVLQREIHND
jgi:hypothetical protein